MADKRYRSTFTNEYSATNFIDIETDMRLNAKQVEELLNQPTPCQEDIAALQRQVEFYQTKYAGLMAAHSDLLDHYINRQAYDQMIAYDQQRALLQETVQGGQRDYQEDDTPGGQEVREGLPDDQPQTEPETVREHRGPIGGPAGWTGTPAREGLRVVSSPPRGYGL
jgi:hypothetical protein